MLLIPAIDLKDGRCVRLKQGDMNDSTVFSENPARWRAAGSRPGARRLHLVDLNGAFAGKPVNESAVKAILAEVGDEIPVQLGGGIRDLDTIERYLDDGLSFIIIGTAAVKNPGFMRDACSAFGGHIIVGLDARTARSRPTAGASSPATRSPTWRRSSRTTASRASSTPTSAATACSPASTSRRP
jgi:phosphoribosylformimino-5-aminoimidazole carboxamide ribotide isomerase